MARVGMLGYVGMGVSDLRAWEQFATEILGLEVSERGPDGTLYLRMDDYHYRIIVQPDGRDDLAFMGWEVTNEEALNALAEQLTANGVEVRRGTKEECEARHVVGLIKFDDPNGIAEEAFYGPLINYLTPFRSPRGVQFETGNMGMGHITMTVENLQESLHFYRDLLGLKLSDWVQPQPERGAASSLNIAFFHCNPRHHSLAFWEGNIGKRIHHFMLQTKSVNDVGQAYDLCQDRGVPIVMSLGRHTNDHMLSFYMGTPSGTAVEYGWGARTVGEDWTVQFHQTGSIWGHRPLIPHQADPA
jgi:2,3-dihydroxybiphenyl 1,2-dioxygenase